MFGRSVGDEVLGRSVWTKCRDAWFPATNRLRVAAALLMAVALSVCAEEKLPVSLDARTDFYSSYVWRGKVLDRHAVAQPSVITTYDAQEYGAFSLKFWVNWDLTQRSSKPKATRTGGGINVFNITPSYSRAFGPVDVTIGNIFYTFPGDGYPKNSNSTYELFTTVAYKNPVVTPSLGILHYRDVGGGFPEDNPLKDLYIRAALDKSVPITERLRRQVRATRCQHQPLQHGPLPSPAKLCRLSTSLFCRMPSPRTSRPAAPASAV